MHGLQRTVDAGYARMRPAALPQSRPAGSARTAWRGFASELADVLCLERTGEGLPMQARDEVTLVLADSAVRMVDPQGHTWVVGPDDVGIGRPGEMYRIDAPADGGTLRVLLVAPAMLPGCAPAGDAHHAGALRFRTPAVRDPQLASRLHALFGELRRGLAALDSLARFRAAVAELAERHMVPQPVPSASHRVHPAAARAHAYLRVHFAEPVSLEALVEVSKLSRFYLLRVFRREYGVSPHEYQRHLRVARACRMLAAGAPPSRTAFEVGLADQSHLNRILKALTGFTPGEFARQWTGRARTRRPRSAHA